MTGEWKAPKKRDGKGQKWTEDECEALAILYFFTYYEHRQIEDLMTAYFNSDHTTKEKEHYIIKNRVKKIIEDNQEPGRSVFKEVVKSYKEKGKYSKADEFFRDLEAQLKAFFDGLEKSDEKVLKARFKWKLDEEDTETYEVKKPEPGKPESGEYGTRRIKLRERILEAAEGANSKRIENYYRCKCYWAKDG